MQAFCYKLAVPSPCWGNPDDIISVAFSDYRKLPPEPGEQYSPWPWFQTISFCTYHLWYTVSVADSDVLACRAAYISLHRALSILRAPISAMHNKRILRFHHLTGTWEGTLSCFLHWKGTYRALYPVFSTGRTPYRALSLVFSSTPL